MQLLAEIDGFSTNDNVKIIAATNRIDILDPALLRPGRFDRIIEVPLPNNKAKKQILKIHANKMALAKGIDYGKLVKLIPQATGADIRTICKEAGMLALRENSKKVKLTHFKNAIVKVLRKPKEDTEAIEKMAN